MQHAGNSNSWSLLPDQQAKPRYARLLREAGEEPIIVRKETHRPGWDTANGTVYSFSDELVEQLERLGQEWGREPAARGLPATEEEEEEEEAGDGDHLEWDEAANRRVEQQSTPQTILESIREGAPEPPRRNSRRVAGQVAELRPMDCTCVM